MTAGDEPTRPRPQAAGVQGGDEPVLPDVSGDERAVGWGADLAEADDAGSADERLLADRPPHWGDD